MAVDRRAVVRLHDPPGPAPGDAGSRPRAGRHRRSALRVSRRAGADGRGAGARPPRRGVGVEPAGAGAPPGADGRGQPPDRRAAHRRGRRGADDPLRRAAAQRRRRALLHDGADPRTRAMIDAEAVIAQLRATDARSGGRREAWREPWVAERARLAETARGAAAEVVIERDAFANTWYVLAGDTDETVLVGSHSDCVPDGGWLDGILGVHAGLGVLAAIAGRPRRRRTLAVVDWADEEGTRFGRSLLGSSAATGSLLADELAALAADDGRAAPDIVAEYGFDPSALGTPSPRLAHVVAAAELHIEQGPRLQREGLPVAAVAGCLGVRRSRITF